MEIKNFACKCVACGKLLRNDDAVREVNLLYGLERAIEPACSMECAEKARRNCLERFDRLLACVRNQKFKEMTAREFLRPFQW